MNDTNTNVQASVTVSDPYTYNFHVTAQSNGTPWVLYAFVIVVILAASGGFLLGFFLGKRRK